MMSSSTAPAGSRLRSLSLSGASAVRFRALTLPAGLLHSSFLTNRPHLRAVQAQAETQQPPQSEFFFGDDPYRIPYRLPVCGGSLPAEVAL